MIYRFIMAFEKKIARLVTMVAPSLKDKLQEEAEKEDVDVSFIVRRALKNRHNTNESV